jgi:hypothetical protein
MKQQFLHTFSTYHINLPPIQNIFFFQIENELYKIVNTSLTKKTAAVGHCDPSPGFPSTPSTFQRCKQLGAKSKL